MIEAVSLTKKYGTKTAVDNVNFILEPGKVTGFLGPNGAGKSTTMRMIAGLDRPTGGKILINGKTPKSTPAPLRTIGILLDAKGVHPSRSARSHLRSLAATHAIRDNRVDEVIELAGLKEVAKKRIGAFSLGMGQRLGIAAALLGDPKVLVLDEPVNGLDPEGVKWVRDLLRYQASLGKTIFVSSHLMSEMAQTADQLVIIGRGKILRTASVEQLIKESSQDQVILTSPDLEALVPALTRRGATVTTVGENRAQIFGLPASDIGQLAAQFGAVLHELSPQNVTLEEAYLSVTENHVEFASTH